MKNIFMFDVESNGLYGEGFAVGAVVKNYNGNVIDTFELKSIEGEEKVNNEWVKENVLPYLKDMKSVYSLIEFRKEFYEFYMKHKNNIVIFSDVNYPVETNFLNAVVMDNMEERQWNMPYPLYDMCNFVPVNMDREKIYNNNIDNLVPVHNNRLRKHHPIDDCKASLYVLLKLAKKEIKKIIK